MGSIILTDEHQRVLSHLELKELTLLNWGATDGSFSKDEILEAIAGAPGVSFEPVRILRDFLDSQLVVRAGDGLPYRYRTRFAETVRLLLKLRQLNRRKNWRDGRFLVSDARIVQRPRVFPVRKIPASEVVSNLTNAGHQDSVIVAASKLVGDKKLSDFQLQATESILRAIETNQNAGFVVSAATSGGKSLAFYLPVLSWIASQTKIGDHWVKTLALYPRNELLKDQLSSVFASARQIDDQQLSNNSPIISVGAFYGSTPTKISDFSSQNNPAIKEWSKRGTGRICPYLRCPNCDGTLLWEESDLRLEIEVLTCEDTKCGYKTPINSIRLTRASMSASPPDIMLTTTEMMNRNMSNASYWHLFGIRTKPPRVFLLDEIHTNEGTSGANTALLIRRWRHLSKNNQCVFVGLSATLSEPQRFFSELTGLSENQVLSIEPHDMEEKGAEYLLAVRSESTTGTSVLSTTIQTVMLMRRMLDTDSAISEGVFGQRLFAFTDKLDVTNRLFDNFRDSEGMNRYGKPDPSYRPQTLANLRSPNHTEAHERETAGQVWAASESIGHGISTDMPLTVGRTASQDPGVDQRDVIIATSALEVGFNDPTVGAVVQHKAPHDASRFLQRKGRAGRTEVMRPYMIVVLSDFGRDRIAYQSYDQLFSPIISAINIPVKNRYVLRMQAAFALMDWIASEIIPPGYKLGSAWIYLASKEKFTRNREKALAIVDDVLNDGHARNRLQRFLKKSLQLDDDDVHAVMWQAPRSILLHVLPTLRRELNSWITEDLKDLPDHKWHPLQEFVPQAMFGDLLVPEVVLRLPAPQRNREPRNEHLGISQTLREFSPGRISRRYGFTHGDESHWIPVPTGGGNVITEVPGDTYNGDWLADGTVKTSTGTLEFPIFRPTAMNLQQPRNLSPSTSSLSIWHCDLTAANGSDLGLVQSDWVQSLFSKVDVFCHALGGSLEVRRFTSRSVGHLIDNHGEKRSFESEFQNLKGEKVALGFSLDVDGIRVLLKPWEIRNSINTEVLPGLLASWFAHLVTNSDNFTGISDLGRGWLRTVALGAIAKTSGANTIQGAWEIVISDPNLQLIKKSAQEILGMPPTESQPQVLRDILSQFDDQLVVNEITNCIEKTRVSNPDFRKFAKDRYVASVAGAFMESLMRIMPSLSPDDLIVDLNAFSHIELGENLEFWVSESEAGSSGIVEEFARIYQSDPEMFWRMMERALEPSDLENVDLSIATVLELATNNVSVRDAFSTVRGSMSIDLASYRNSLSNLFTILESVGISVDRSLSVAISSRLLSAGTGAMHDELRTKLRTDWVLLERSLGVEIDVRAFACKWAEDDGMDSLFSSGAVSSCDRHGFVQSLLWPRGGLVRELQYELPQPFGDSPKPDRLLVPLIKPRIIDVRSGREVIDAELLSKGFVTVSSDKSTYKDLADLMKDFATVPTDSGFLNIHPRMASCIRRAEQVHVRIELVEVMK